jgi:tetratricopeptide (TPR) repeat protein
VVVSAPDDQRPLDTEEEIGAIQRALDEATRAGRVEVEYLDDATLPAIGEALRRFRPHVLHYTGHGYYDKTKAASFLALEDDDGCTRLAGIADLRPLLHDDPDLRLALLSGCQTAQTSDVDAFAGVATGLLAEAVPAVLAMQYSILDQSGITLAAAFYAALAEGATPIEAAHRVRIALWQDREGPGYDWGIPALYLRAPEMRLVGADDGRGDRPVAPTRGLLLDVGGLPLPPHFVGRKPELRALRRALADSDVTAAYVRGIGGMGKSSLAAKFLERPGLPPDGVLVIRCNETAALDIPVKLARWLEAQGKASHAEAAALLLDSRLDPADRTRQAIARIADRRYVLVFDNFESVMDFPAQGHAEPSRGEASQSPEDETLRRAAAQGDSAFAVADPDLAAFFDGLLAARWRGLSLFTVRYRWAALEEYLGRGATVELHLPELTAPQAIMLMDNLPRLRREPIATKLAVYRKVGGHPKSIELLEGWLASGRVTDLLADPSLDGMLAQQWADYFLRALLAQLTAGERDALARLCIFETSLDQEAFEYAEIKPAWVRRWLDLSLVQRAGGGMPDIPPHMQGVWALLPESEKRKFAPPEAYTVHPVVRESLVGRMAKDERRSAHKWAAKFYGRPFVEVARQAVAGSSTLEARSWTDEEIEDEARNGAVEFAVRRTDDLAQARAAIGRCLAWREHLFAAGEFEAAGEIVTAVYDILARWGERDRAKALLRGSIGTLEGFTKAVAQGNLANLLQEEGKLAEALATHEAGYRTFEADGAKQQMAAALTQIASVYQDQGNYDKAIGYEERSLAIERERDNEEGQAISLHQISMLYRHKEDYAAALARSQEAETLFRKLGMELHMATTLHEQGIIYAKLARAATEEAEAGRQSQAAFGRFTESLATERRIGNEVGTASTLNELGKLLRDVGQMKDAIAMHSEALEIHQRANNPAKVGLTLEFLGSVHERQGQLAAALEKYQQALELYRQYAPPEVERCKRNIALLRGKMGNG